MRGQSSFEAISLFATATIILSIFMIYFGSQISTQAEEREYLTLRDVADTLRQEILIARQAGPGYTRRIEIPPMSGSKPIIFNLEYSDDPNVSSELTVSFIPPIKETIEASRLLGPGVYGLFSGGENRIKVYDGGIVVEPDLEEIVDLLDEGLVELDDLPKAEIAFAYIEGPNVRLADADRIECEYALSNEWRMYDTRVDGNPGEGNKRIEVGWIAHTESGGMSCLSGSEKIKGSSFYLSELPTLPPQFRSGSNLSCVVRYFTSAGGGGSGSDTVCDVVAGTASLDQRIAISENVSIVNSLPEIEATLVGVDRDDGEGRTVWTIDLDVEVTDADTDDDLFNVSLVQDGTNAAFIECAGSNNGCLVKPGVYGGTDVRFRFVYDAPWPEGRDCEAIDDLSFRIKANEADSTSELYTLEPVDVSHALDCPVGPDA